MLDDAQQRAMMPVIARWRSDPRRPVACPACGKAGLAIIDRSARPYVEWYTLHCGACGPSVPTLD